MKTNEAVSALESNFPESILKKTVFCDQTTVDVNKNDLIKILEFLKAAGFDVLMDLTGVDYVCPEKKTDVVYFLYHSSNHERMRLRLSVGRGEEIPSVTMIWPGASWYERELFDLFGVGFKGHPDLKRILMPDDWVGHPLRKDYALTEEPVEFKHGVTPKVPSEIIPHVKPKTNS